MTQQVQVALGDTSPGWGGSGEGRYSFFMKKEQPLQKLGMWGLKYIFKPASPFCAAEVLSSSRRVAPSETREGRRSGDHVAMTQDLHFPLKAKGSE